MIHPFYAWLEKAGKVDSASIRQLSQNLENRPFSLHREVSFLIYAGLLIGCSGLGILIYEHIGEFGHILLLMLIFGGSLFGLFFSHRRFPAFTWEKSDAPSLFMSFVVLGCTMLFMVGEGYIEFRYNWFEEKYQILGALSALFCLLIAYRFDHQGVLSIGLSALAATVGLSILPGKWFFDGLNAFSLPMASTAILFGLFLLVSGYLLAGRGLKAHFESTYASIGSFLVLMGLFWLQVDAELNFLYSFLCLGVSFLLFLYARKLKSVFIYVLVVFAGYFSITALLVRGLNSDFIALMFFYYGPVTLAGVTYLLVKYKRFLNLK